MFSHKNPIYVAIIIGLLVGIFEYIYALFTWFRSNSFIVYFSLIPLWPFRDSPAVVRRIIVGIFIILFFSLLGLLMGFIYQLCEKIIGKRTALALVVILSVLFVIYSVSPEKGF